MAKKRLDSKRTSKKIFVSKTDVEIIEKKCRKCLEVKAPNQFYQSVDDYLDSDGLFSVCKQCMTDIFDISLLHERTINRALLDFCRTLNICFSDKTVESVLTQIKKAEDNGKKPRHPMAIYMQRLRVMVARGQAMESSEHHDLTFFEVKPLVTEEDAEMLSSSDFWGENIPTQDIEYLEREYRKLLGGGASPDNYTEKLLLKRISYKLLDIKKSQESEGKKKMGTLEKELLLLFKEAALSPAHANAASGGKSIDTYGMWLSDIERYSPAEWLEKEGKDMFYDVSDVDFYFQKYIVRPLKNFVTGQPEYSTMEEGDEENGEKLSIE